MFNTEVSHELLLAQVKLEADIAYAEKIKTYSKMFLTYYSITYLNEQYIDIHFSSLASNSARPVI
jgi:hypothetical protein